VGLKITDVMKTTIFLMMFIPIEFILLFI